MKRLSVLILIGCACNSCLGSSEYYRGVLTLAAVMQSDQPEPVKCTCNGSGTTGDGLAPCQCGDNCQCKKETLNEELIKSEPVIAIKRPKLQLLYFSTSNCPPCDRVKTELDILKQAGWKINSSDDSHIIVKSNPKRFRVTSFPCFILLADGVEVKRHTGFMDRWQIATFRKHEPPQTVMGVQPVQGISVPGLRTPFEKAISTLKDMLGTTYKPNAFVTVRSPKRIEMSVEERNGKIHFRFHGTQPTVSAVGVFESEVTHMIAEGNQITVYWNGVIGLLKNNLTVEFE